VAASILCRAAKKGAKLIIVDPRYSEMSKYADIVITPNPGADISLFNSLLYVIIKENLYDKDYINTRTKNFDEFCKSLESFSPESAAESVGVSVKIIEETARLLGNAKTMLIFWGMGITQHVHGVNNVRCLVNLALATGNIGKPGAGLHPLRGQNNVQGVCDMGLLPNFLPGYAKVSESAQRQRFETAWQTTLSDKAGLTMVEMIKGVTNDKIKGLYFMGENPAMSDPNITHVIQALSKLDHLVVQDLFLTETAQYADVVLPATSLLEKCGTFTNTNRQVQLGRQVIDAIEDVKQDWWITQEIANRLGLKWNYQHPKEIWKEIQNLWPAVKGISWSRLEKDGWCQYPCKVEDQIGKDVLFNDRFPTEDGLAKFVAVKPESPCELTDLEYPLVLITGRLLEHWHTGVMTRRSAYLKDIKSEAQVYLSEDDMRKLNVIEDDMVEISSRRGSIVALVKQDLGLSEGSVFMPFCYAEAAANVLTIDALDPQSKIPEYKYCAIKLHKASIN
jgi:formate dehydrogenase major subunit